MSIKKLPDYVKSKGVLVLSFGQPSQTQVSEHSPYTSIANLLHIRITPENNPSLVENPVSHGRKVKQYEYHNLDVHHCFLQVADCTQSHKQIQ